MAALAMTIERVRAFNGLDVLIAKDEGLVAAEGLDLRIATPAAAEFRINADKRRYVSYFIRDFPGDPHTRGRPLAQV